jgi:hypothetical protein
MKKTKILYFRLLVALSVIGITSQIALAQQTKEAFTVADDIALTYFAPPGGGRVEVQFSPDGNYFAVWSERGRLDLNCVEDSLRFYRRQDVEAFLKRSDASRSAKPVWIVNRPTRREPSSTLGAGYPTQAEWLTWRVEALSAASDLCWRTFVEK